jgi:hypothetical protein
MRKYRYIKEYVNTGTYWDARCRMRLEVSRIATEDGAFERIV